LKLLRSSGIRGISTSSVQNGKQVSYDDLPPKSRSILKREYEVTCHNYASLPAVITHGKGVFLYDVEGMTLKFN
jgi:hypothetical protein